MSATKPLSARTLERHGTVVQQNRVRLEELESRMLLSRAAFSGEPLTTGDSSDPPPDEAATTAIVARETTESTSTTPDDSTAESDQGGTQTQDTATQSPPDSDEFKNEGSLISDTGEAASSLTAEPPLQETSTPPTREGGATRTSESDQGNTQTQDATTPSPSDSDTIGSESKPVNDTGKADSSPTLKSPPQEPSTTLTRQIVASRTIESFDEPSSGSTTSSDDPQPTDSDASSPSSTPASGTTTDSSEPAPKTEPSPQPTGPRKIEPMDEPKPTQPPVSDSTDEPDPTPVRPVVRPEPVSDVEKTDEPTTKPAEPAAETGAEKSESDSTSNDAEAEATSDQSPNCITRETARTATTECSTQQLAMTAQPPEGSDDPQEAAPTDRVNPETIVEQAASPESLVIETPQAATVPPRSEPSNAEAAADQSSGLSLPDSLLADVLTDALADEQPVGEGTELGQTVFAAGAFAVVFSKPLSRLSGSDSSPFGDAAASGTVPILYTRKRRKDSRSSPAGTKEKPDDTDDPDDDRQPSRGRGPDRDASKFDGRMLAGVAEQYESIEAAIRTTLDSWRDDPNGDSPHSSGIIHSAKSFAAGALAAATVLLTLQGSRRTDRARPQLRPAVPTYHGQTAVAAN